MKKIALGVVVVFLISAAVLYAYLRSIGMFASDPVYANTDGAILGYDPVAYFTDSTATKGVSGYSLDWNGRHWLFASAKHRAMFAANPEKYAPQFGGYCAYAVAHNYTARPDPNAWTITGSRLYLNYDMDTQNKWLADRDNFIRQAETNWPSVLR
jgi:YHS domain-containing protein